MKFFSFFVVFVLAAAAASAEDLCPDVGAVGIVTNSVAMIGVSIVLSMFAIFNH
jgi:hypothetical protein